MVNTNQNRPISENPTIQQTNIHQWTILKQKCAHFSNKMVHCGIRDWCILGLWDWGHDEMLVVESFLWGLTQSQLISITCQKMECYAFIFNWFKWNDTHWVLHIPIQNSEICPQALVVESGNRTFCGFCNWPPNENSNWWPTISCGIRL